MKQNLFISYSRRQTPFVDRFADKLEDDGYFVWLDYQKLVPAKPWLDQINAGIDAADVFFLVVSEESISSRNVAPEWKRALDKKKRIILIIFEAVPLPAELQGCEWVDFRTKYKQSFRELLERIEKPQPVTGPVPQSGFKGPKRFWLALGLSVLLIFASLPTWWTLFVPFILVPLPRDILRRNYIFSRVIPMLVLLPFIFAMTDILFFFSQDTVFYSLSKYVDPWFIPASLISWTLAILLLTPVMQRRAKPEGARVRFANPLVVDVKSPRSVVFAIEHALEDERYANDLRRGLERYGHRLAGENEIPEAVFVLISEYQKTTKYDPDHQAIYPILLQAVKDIDPKLSRIQRIDFRNGIRSMNKLARLLPEPERLLKALAVPPVGSQEVFPFAVSVMQYFYLITGILGGGGLLTSLLSVGFLILRGDIDSYEYVKFLLVTLNGLLLLGAVVVAVWSLRFRAGGASALYPLSVLTVFQMVMHLGVFMLLTTSKASDDATFNALYSAASGTLLSVLAFPAGLVLIILILLFRWKDLYRWLPRRQGTALSQVERILLLYTPSRARLLGVHVIFHALLILVYTGLIFSFSFGGFSTFLIILVPFLLILIGLHRLAQRTPKGIKSTSNLG